MTILKLLGGIILVILLITFSLKNTQYVNVEYYSGLSLQRIPLFLLIFISILIGMFIGNISGMFEKIQLRRKLRKQAEIIKDYEKKLNLLTPDNSERTK